MKHIRRFNELNKVNESAEYFGIKKEQTSGDDYKLYISDEKWGSDGKKGAGDHCIAFTKGGTFYVKTDGSWDWEMEPKSKEVKELLKKYVGDNKIEKLSPDSIKFLG